MSYLDSNSFIDYEAFAGGEPSSLPGRFAAQDSAADRAIDAALRSVPLPHGLLTRLGMLVYTTSDEAADQADWLGC